MELTTILNHCYPQAGFVYEKARFRRDRKAIGVPVRPRRGSQAICSGCERPATGYDVLAERRFEFIPFWGLLIFLVYARRRVQCRQCCVVVEKIPWSGGQYHSTKAHRLFLAHWARKRCRSKPLGIACMTLLSMWWSGACSITRWNRFTPS